MKEEPILRLLALLLSVAPGVEGGQKGSKIFSTIRCHSFMAVWIRDFIIYEINIITILQRSLLRTGTDNEDVAAGI